MELASQRANRAKRRVRFITAVTCIVLLSWLVKRVFVSHDKIISPIPDTPVSAVAPTHKPIVLFAKKKDPEQLKEKITGAIGDSWNDYSVVVQDYTSDFSVTMSEGEIFVAASVNKVPILAVLYYLAQQGDIDLDRDITLQAKDVQDYGTGSIRYDKPGTIYSIKTLAKLMIKQSDNTAAYILATQIIGYPKLKEIVSQWGLTQTDMVTNKTSNKDIATVFRMIYDRKITDEAHTQEMLSFLKDTDHETRLPDQLPDGVTTYHKIGTEVGIIHDAGIITDEKQAYYVGIFTNGTAEDQETDALMAKISKVVYDYMK